jgi:hypothetical protein
LSSKTLHIRCYIVTGYHSSWGKGLVPDSAEQYQWWPTRSNFEWSAAVRDTVLPQPSIDHTLQQVGHFTPANPMARDKFLIQDFRVAIIGGGIGGLCTALSIARYCPALSADKVTVFEQAPEYKEIGAGVSIGVSAGRVLQKLGVYEATNAISGHRTNVHRSNRRWDTDELIVDAPAANSGGAHEDVRQLWLHRAEFLEILYSEVRRRQCATLQTNKKVVSLEVALLVQVDIPLLT